MWRRNLVLAAVVAVVLGGLGIEQALLAADAGGGGGGQRAPRDPAAMQQRMEQFRAQAAERMKTTLGVTDEEWKVLQPKIEECQTLARQLQGGAMGGMGGAGGMFGGRRGGAAATGTDANAPAAAPQPDPNRPQSDIQKKMTALQTVLANKEAKPEEITAALAAVREARAAAQAKLDAAEKELRKIVTVRQEGLLFTMNVLH
jgi:hypothetical protein